MKFTKDMLQSGYVVRFRNNPYSEYGMYFSLEDIEGYQYAKPLEISHIITDLIRYNDIGVFISKTTHDKYPNWSPLHYYSEDLISDEGKYNFDIVEVYPIKTKLEFLSSQALGKLVRNINPIKINQ